MLLLIINTPQCFSYYLSINLCSTKREPRSINDRSPCAIITNTYSATNNKCKTVLVRSCHSTFSKWCGVDTNHTHKHTQTHTQHKPYDSMVADGRAKTGGQSNNTINIASMIHMVYVYSIIEDL